MIQFCVTGELPDGVGTAAGLPAAGCTHEVAQAVAPECAVVYVDNDPDALAQGAGLLGESSLSDCAYLGADMRDTEEIIRASGRARAGTGRLWRRRTEGGLMGA